MRTHTATVGVAILGTTLAALAVAPHTPAEAGLVAAATPARAPTGQKLRGKLAGVLRAADAAEHIPISIVMRDQLGQADFAAMAPAADKKQRRAAVVASLKDLAAATNGGVVGFLEQEREAGKVGARIRALWIRNVVATEATPDVIRRIAERDDVAWVNYDEQFGVELFPAMTPAQLDGAGGAGAGENIECGVQLMNAPTAWSDGWTGEGTVVGIIDTGCCITHPDLENQIWDNADEIAGNNIDDDNNGYIDDKNGYNFRDGNGNVADTNGHGTHTAGTVCGDGAQGTTTGMAPNTRMMILKFWNSFAGESIVWEAMEYATANDADVITASIGWPHSQDPDRVTWRNTCEASMAAGVVVIYAAGNEGGGNPPDNVRTPGDVPDMITCGATDCNMNIAGFSSRGPITWQGIEPFDDYPYPPGYLKPTTSAPGVDTISTSSNCSGYATLSGTSMATPHIAGAAALVLEANPALDHYDVKQIFKDASIDRGAEGPDNTYGAGFLDAYDAVEIALSMGGIDGDVDDDGDVDFGDVLLILAAWGPVDDCPPSIPEDVDDDCDVDFDDLLIALSNWTV